MNTFKKAKQYLIQTYFQYPIEIVKGKGRFVWDKKNKKYLDFYGGHAVALLGHCPDEVISAMMKQAQILIFYSNIFFTKPAADLAEKIAKTLLPEKYKVFLSNSGSEANENAIKMARKFSGKRHMISFKDSFHGRSTVCVAVTGIPSYHQFSPNIDEYSSFAEFGNIESVQALYNDDTAAVICEPIQSIGGVNIANKKFYKDLEKFCHDKNILLIFDEVQTGLGRTGSFWFSRKLGVKPDIITTAKGLASGLPISAVIVSKKIADTIKRNEYATTFGGGPLVCAAGLATLDTILSKGFLENVERNSEYLKSELQKNPFVKQILGTGFLLGVELKEENPGLVEKCLKHGLIVGTSKNSKIIRLLPPLNTNREEIDLFLRLFKKSLT